jgi:hypothetical protein
MKIQRRTFAAKLATEPSERARLNLDALTSEYMPSHRYIVQEPLPYDHPTQKHFNHTFRSKSDAETWLSSHKRCDTNSPT